MGYTIHYHKEGTRTVKKRYFLLGIGLIAVMIFLFANWSDIRMILLPGDPEVTEEALEVFSSMLSDGATVTEAFVTFCRKVLEGAYYG